MTRKEKSNRLEKLRKHWSRASPQERDRFLAELRETVSLEQQEHRAAELRYTPIANGRYLLPQTVQRVEAILKRRRIGPIEMVAELGFPKEALAMTRGLAHGRSLRLVIITALAEWLEQNEAASTRLVP